MNTVIFYSMLDDKQSEVQEIIERIKLVSRPLGYAIATHGSLKRDIDIIACPWIEDASDPEELIEAIRKETGGYFLEDRNNSYDWVYSGSRPEPKSHGRLAWSIYGVLGTYLDISVMPKISA